MVASDTAAGGAALVAMIAAPSVAFGDVFIFRFLVA
jgi:hypothetical protein